MWYRKKKYKELTYKMFLLELNDQNQPEQHELSSQIHFFFGFSSSSFFAVFFATALPILSISIFVKYCRWPFLTL